MGEDRVLPVPESSESLEVARAYFAEHADHQEFALYTEALRLGRADVLFASAAGVLMHLHHTNNYLVAALSEQDARTVLAALPPKGKADDPAALTTAWEGSVSATAPTASTPTAFVAAFASATAPVVSAASASSTPAESRVFMFSDERIARALGFDGDHCEPYYFYIYERTEPLPLRGALAIKPLTLADVPVVEEHYALLSPAEIRRHVADGWVWGGYNEQGELVGFIGEHDEASMGMLEVFPQYRRHGYARELQGASINRLLAAGRIPYSQVALDNVASRALQRSTNMTQASTIHAWCWE